MLSILKAVWDSWIHAELNFAIWLCSHDGDNGRPYAMARRDVAFR